MAICTCKSKNEKRLLTAFFIFVFIFLIVILVTVLVVVPELPKVVYQSQLCLPSREAGSKLLCGSALYILPRYLKKSLDKAYENLQDKRSKERDEMSIELSHYLYKIYLAAKPAARYSAHVQNEVPDKQGLSELMMPVTVWNNGNDQDNRNGFQRFGVRLENGRIIVPLSGTYLVYSFLDLYEEMELNKSVSKRDRPIMHSIYVFNFTERTEKEVMTSCHPHQSTLNRRFNIYSSCIMTLVDLRAGDEVMVKINDMSLLQYPVFNTFGLNLV